MLCPLYFHNTFKTNCKWQVVSGCISRQKSNFSGEFKLEPITNYPLRICCENVMNV